MIATLRLRNIGSHVCAAASPRPGAVSRSFCGRVAETPPSQAELALIVGAGPGISAACARLFRKEGMEVAIAARSISKPAVASLVAKHGCHAFHCDAADPGSVDSLFSAIATKFGRPPALVVYNPSGRAKGPVETLDPAAVRDALLVSAFGAFLVAQAAAKVMLPVGRGSILFTGASASYKGFANSSSFAMGSFGRHGLAQSLNRELGPRGIHVAHFPIDGLVAPLDDETGEATKWRYKDTDADGGLGSSEEREAGGEDVDNMMLHPDAIAETYLYIHKQPRSAWTFEVQLRPWAERW